LIAANIFRKIIDVATADTTPGKVQTTIWCTEHHYLAQKRQVLMTDIKQHPNYGKDLITLQRDARFSFPEFVRMILATIRMINRIRTEIGLRNTLAIFQDVKVRVRQVLKSDDLSAVRHTGISERDLEEMVERIALGETLTNYLGLEKAKTIRTSLSKEIAPVFFPKLFPTSKELESFPGGYLPNLKKFITSYAYQNTLKNLQVGSITEETVTGFKLVITSCNFAKVAEIMGDPEICYWTTCVTDGYFFPIQADQAGVMFKRQGTIATGHSVCDFCWEQSEEREICNTKVQR
jgi:hypothetical protein